MQSKYILRIALATGCLLLVPLLGNLFIDGWNWRPHTFAVWGTILFCTGLMYELVAMKGDTSAYPSRRRRCMRDRAAPLLDQRGARE